MAALPVCEWWREGLCGFYIGVCGLVQCESLQFSCQSFWDYFLKKTLGTYCKPRSRIYLHNNSAFLIFFCLFSSFFFSWWFSFVHCNVLTTPPRMKVWNFDILFCMYNIKKGLRRNIHLLILDRKSISLRT